jgi:hypothetical protein
MGIFGGRFMVYWAIKTKDGNSVQNETENMKAEFAALKTQILETLSKHPNGLGHEEILKSISGEFDNIFVGIVLGIMLTEGSIINRTNRS